MVPFNMKAEGGGGETCQPNVSFVPNQPCGVLPLADLQLPVSMDNLHLLLSRHMRQCPHKQV